MSDNPTKNRYKIVEYTTLRRVIWCWLRGGHRYVHHEFSGPGYSREGHGCTRCGLTWERNGSTLQTLPPSGADQSMKVGSRE